ncbi:MAG: Gfo/Idh/MocA family oxidoreductase [Chloroflexi bacterium]|nr:Gfo/Idh/MocA family oxidoreductase [Chloroflexota bacterium]
MSKLRVGVIGLGILGSQHTSYLHEHEATQVVAVADIRPDVAQRVAGQVGAQGYGDYQEMLRQHALDLVVVATPDPLHREPVMAALAAGVPNILEEKPFASTWEDALDMYEAVERRGARLFVHFANRATPLDIATRYVIQQGLLGRAVYGEARLDDNISVPTQMWGERTREWAGGSSTAHFLLSHVVDLLRWYFAPAEVKEVYAISQREVLWYTPDVYDAYLTFDSGLKVRVKAEWIRHMDELVEFYLSFSGSEGTLIYNKRGGFGTEPGWRANVSGRLSAEQLIQHQEALLARGANVAAKLHRPTPTAGSLAAGGGQLARALEYRGLGYGEPMALVNHCLAAIEQGTLEPEGWKGNGPLPTHVDGLRQTQITMAIIRSAESGRVVALDSM